MLKYLDPEQKNLAASGYDNRVVTQILVPETDVHHSGIYQCEPGASPTARVNVHVLDGKFYWFSFKSDYFQIKLTRLWYLILNLFHLIIHCILCISGYAVMLL